MNDVKGVDAIRTMGLIINPLTKILADGEIKKKKTRLEAVEYALTNYPEEVLYIMALVEGVDPKEYEPSLLSLPRKMVELTDNEDVQYLFTSAATTAEKESFGSATESTAETA